MASMKYLRNVATLKLDAERCIGCGVCSTVCPHAVFNIEEKQARIVNKDACMECGACALNCPVSAISVRAGVGCASGILAGALRGTEPACGDDCCGTNKGCC